jgi:DNA gyrase/topoisomerase IV subunit B
MDFQRRRQPYYLCKRYATVIRLEQRRKIRSRNMPIDHIADEIQVLEDGEPVRKRPEMYVGPLPDPAVVNRLVQEVLCLSIDEALCGRCTEIAVAVDSAGVITVRDNGPGLPMEPGRHGLVLAEVLLTVLHACRAAKQSEAARAHCCEIGLVIVNYLSQWLRVRVFRDGGCWAQEYRYGKPQAPFRREAETRETGLEFSFLPDSSILGETVVDPPTLAEWLPSTGVKVESFECRQPSAGEPLSLRFRVRA